MKDLIKEKLRGFRAEKIAEVVLLRTGLVDIKSVEGAAWNIVAFDKSKASNSINVIVKEAKDDLESANKKLKVIESDINKLFRKLNVPIILFLIDPDRESGHFAVYDGNPHSGKLLSLRMDVFRKSLNSIIKKYDPMEFPPYKFYQKEDDSKYEIGPIYTYSYQFETLQLISICVSPIKVHSELSFEVEINNGNPRVFYLSDMHHKPNTEYYFFLGKNKQPVKINMPLPSEVNTIVLRVNLLSDVKDFDLRLNCKYI